MKKNSLASLELAAIINELQFLKKGKISQIYHQERELILQLHVPGKGKQLLKIIPGKLLCLTKDKNPPVKPSGFCMQLRKYLDNAFIKDIYQKDAERIVVLGLEKKENYFLILELFSKGNIILTDNSFKIIGALEQQHWKDRNITVKEKYVFPPPGINWKTITNTTFEQILKNSEKRNLATTLATEVNLGGAYAEEICQRTGLDKNKAAQDLTEEEMKNLFSEIKEIVNQLTEPQGYIYEEEITPFPLLNKKFKDTTPTYNEAIDRLNPFQVISPYNKKIGSLQRRIQEQQQAVVNLEQQIIDEKRKAELIYENYSLFQEIQSTVTKGKATTSWTEIATKLKTIKAVRNIDLKDKRVILDLQ